MNEIIERVAQAVSEPEVHTSKTPEELLDSRDAQQADEIRRLAKSIADKSTAAQAKHIRALRLENDRLRLQIPSDEKTRTIAATNAVLPLLSQRDVGKVLSYAGHLFSIQIREENSNA